MSDASAENKPTWDANLDRERDFFEACAKALELIDAARRKMPETGAKRMHAKNKIEATIARANRIGKPLGLDFQRTMRKQSERTRRHDRIARVAVLFGAAASIGLLAWFVVWLTQRG